ncbi:MAG TPA: SDR family NAD(P)-dependent oxidoreductase [Acidimicrobiales bacterium]|nr:SDR family NAD(P)-dependent oxidoreductase [Acidimicrobiales bacterium]
MRLEGRVALVSGSTRGIGRSICQVFASEGAKVAVTGRTVERGRKVVDLIREAGGEAEFFELDVSREDSVRSVTEAVADRFGSITTLVNNAAPTVEVGSSIKPLTDFSTEEWNYVLTATLTGPVFWACKYGIPHLRAAGGGTIVNISSGQSVIGMGGFSPYTAAKGGINSLTRSIAVEEAEHNIRCNAIVVGRVVAKGDMGAGMVPGHLTRYGHPDDIAYAALYLASDESAFVTGSILTADGGFTINAGRATPAG